MATSLSTGRTGPLKWGSDQIIPQTLKKKKTSEFKLSDYQTICQIIRSHFRLSDQTLSDYPLLQTFSDYDFYVLQVRTPEQDEEMYHTIHF